MLFTGLSNEIHPDSPEETPILPESKPFDDVDMSKEEEKKANALASVITTVEQAYLKAKDARTPQERKWLDSYKAWRGEYSEEEKAQIAQAKQRNLSASEVFIKITKTKTTAALGQVSEVLFAGGRFPLGIEPTPEPEGVAKEAFIVPENLPIPGDIYGYHGDGETLEPGATGQTLLSGLWNKYKTLLQGKKVIEGPSPDPSMFPQLSPAQESAQLMERMILDQIEEGNVRTEMRKSLWECLVLGTGCMKGPLTYEQTTHSWKKEGDEIKYDPKQKDMPRSFHVSIWNLYPDPDNRSNDVQASSFIVEKHLFNRQQVMELKKFKGFDENAIERVLRNTPKREQEYWESAITDVNQTFSDERYEILEYWGYLKKEDLLYLPEVDKKRLATLTDQAQVNVWVCAGELLRVVINPFVPARLPYYVFPFEEHNYQLWGTSIPENMKDPQMLMNGHTRMWIDNLKFAGSVILEVNENQLVPGQDMTIYPGKIFRKQGGAPGQSIYSISVNNTAQEHMQAFDKARALADEVTGQPSYAYGQTGAQSGIRSAAQQSMLMGAAAGNIKQVIKNIDDYFLSPLGEAYFAWNMQFNPKADIRGDVRIVAKGTSALMQKEVQSQRLLQFLQVVSANPLLTPFANMDYILKQIAISLDLDPEKTVNDPKMAKLVADIMGMMQGSMAGQQAATGGEGAMNPSDTSGAGGGNIGVGMAPTPGEPGFSSNEPPPIKG